MSEKRESAISLLFFGKGMALRGIGKRHKKGGVVKNAKSTPPVFVILTIEVLYQFFAVVSEFVVCFFEE